MISEDTILTSNQHISFIQLSTTFVQNLQLHSVTNCEHILIPKRLNRPKKAYHRSQNNCFCIPKVSVKEEEEKCLCREDNSTTCKDFFLNPKHSVDVHWALLLCLEDIQFNSVTKQNDAGNLQHESANNVTSYYGTERLAMNI